MKRKLKSPSDLGWHVETDDENRWRACFGG